MSKVEILRALIKQRLSAAAEEIFELFERTLAEYEEEICRSKEKKHNLLDSDHKQEAGLHTSDVQPLMVSKEEEVPSEQQQERGSSLNQEDPPEPAHIKEEELWSSQEGEQLQEPEEADISMFISTLVPVKSEEEDGADCGGSEPDRDIDVRKFTPDDTSHLPGSDTDNSGDWEESDEHQEGLKLLPNKDVPVSDMNCTGYSNTGDASAGFSECPTSFGEKKQLKTRRRIQSGEKPFICSVCGKIFGRASHLKQHSSVHTGKKLFICSVCGQRFTQSGSLNRHSKVHTGEKPFSCSVCGKGFTRSESLKEHYVLHSGEKPFSCSVCDRRFTQRKNVRKHKCVGKRSQNE